MSKKSSSKTNFLAQGTILVIASFVAKAIGMIYRIPLTHILGDDGNGYYSTANEIYTIILMISSFSLPLAVSRLVAEREYAGEVKNSYRVLICSLRFAAVTGGILSILTFLLGGVITKYVMGVELASYALRVLAPAIFLFALTGVLRGFFQGHGTMVPTAISQIIEQVINAIISVAGAYVMLQYGLKLGEKKGDAELGTALAAAGGTFGTVASVGVALLFMIVIYLGYRNGFKRRMKKDKTRRRESDRAIYRAITYTILPIVLSTLVYNISTIIDQGVFNHILAGMGFTQKQYATVWGIYSGKFRVLMNVPLSIASCLAPSVVPALTEAMANNDLREAGLRTRDTIRYTMVFTIPCAVGMAALARPIMMMLYGNNDSLALAAGIMQSGALLTVLLALSTLTTGILQGLGEMQAPLVHAATAVAIHLGFLVLFVVKFKWNIYGVVYANIIFGLIICLLNARSIRKKLHYRQEIKKTFLVPVIAAGVMGIAAYLVHRVFNLFAGNTISTILAVCVGAVVYGICLVKLGGILEREIRRLPKGDLLADLLIRLNIL
ncbi:polysaccharide biosynthesis protein [Lachnospiraceae bacterium CLA-AA-H246]|uniref:Polysaccharide biosynthesis protein n=1 Tax=Hominisplanchenecus faecis TaxID=2885351 RepID=A0ABS8EUK6_9FIRM|nr:polysaccharide biosynthesis protein [Hominisplanchenecus faecis]MCC2147889.1 polysaccharide biosynthesis protein [Hominisplanchenecus faecis]MCM0703577.1 polysaccharide biosynthesis protein [Faecalicatena sp. BF-R-105]